MQFYAYLTGGMAFAAYWLILLVFAGLEIARPLRPRRGDGDARLVTNFAMGLIGAVITALPLMSNVPAGLWAEQRGIGLLNQFDWPLALRVGAGFLLFDLSAYLFHCASHAVPLLWRFHRVHHTDNTLDISTFFRSHPGAVLLQAGFALLVIAGLGIPPLALALHGIAKLFTMGLGHANIAIWPRLGRVIVPLVVTPAFHHRHHSARNEETDSNYGEVLTIWDRLFGTATALAPPVERYGLGEAWDADAASLRRQLALPFATE